MLVIVFALSPFKSFAHNAFFLQALIDKNTMQYQVNVVEDKANFWNQESKHMEAQLGDFSKLIKDNMIEVPASGKKYKESSTDGSKEMPFTFPPKEAGDGWMDGKAKNNATRKDADRAYLIKETLVPGLNDALRILNNGKPFESVKDLIDMSNKLSKGGIIGNYEVIYGKRASYSADEPKLDKRTGIASSDYVLIRNVKNPSEEYEFVYRVPKGYNKKGNWDNEVYNKNYDLSGDTDAITWNMIMYQANYAYLVKGWTAKDANEINKVGPLEEAIVDLFENFFNGLRNFLGLYSMSELIFNDGIRGSSAWYHGVMPKSWEDNVMKYHWVFQGFAWSLIALALVKMLIQRNLATINPVIRVSLIESIQNLLITGFILVNILPLVNMFLYFNEKLVDIFASLAPDFTDLSGLNNYSNTIAGVVLQFFYFFVSLYLNFVYIVRSISLALLIAAGPLFVVTLAFGGKWKELFGVWMRELLSNIYLQSFHAFILAFFVTTTFSSRGIETLVVCFSMIPLTEFFRRLIMGQGGGIAHQLGVRSFAAASMMAGGAIRSMSMSRQGNEQARQERINDRYVSTEAGSERYLRNGAQFQTNNSSVRSYGGSSVASSSSSINTKTYPDGSALAEKEVLDNKEIPLDIYTKELSMYMGKEISGWKAGMKDAGKALKSSLDPTNVGKATVGATKAMAGVGMGLALGGVSGDAMDQAGAMVTKGMRQVGSVAKGAKDAVISGAKAVYQGAKSDIQPIVKEMTTSGTGSSSDIGTNTDTSPESSSYISDYLYLRQLGNGDIEVHRDGVVLSQQGILRANDDSEGNAVYTYDINRLNQIDRTNLEHYAQLYQSGEDGKNWLRQHGIERVSVNRQGHYIVAYNDIGKQQLGIKSVRTMGDGRIVEIKRSYDPLATFKTVSLPSFPVTSAENKIAQTNLSSEK